MIFTLESLVSVGLFTLTSVTSLTILFDVENQMQTSLHHSVGQELAWQYLEESKQVHFRGTKQAEIDQAGIVYEVQVNGDLANQSIQTEVSWTEKNGRVEHVELETLDLIT